MNIFLHTSLYTCVSNLHDGFLKVESLGNRACMLQRLTDIAKMNLVPRLQHGVMVNLFWTVIIRNGENEISLWFQFVLIFM